MSLETLPGTHIQIMMILQFYLTRIISIYDKTVHQSERFVPVIIVVRAVRKSNLRQTNSK